MNEGTTEELTEEQVERETVLEVDVERAWEVISDASMLERWLADEVELEPVEGAPARFQVEGEDRPGRVERVVEGRELAFTWERSPGEESLVRFELTPCVGGTRITVVETRLSGCGLTAHVRVGWGATLSTMRALSALVIA